MNPILPPTHWSRSLRYSSAGGECGWHPRRWSTWALWASLLLSVGSTLATSLTRSAAPLASSAWASSSSPEDGLWKRCEGESWLAWLRQTARLRRRNEALQNLRRPAPHSVGYCLHHHRQISLSAPDLSASLDSRRGLRSAAAHAWPLPEPATCRRWLPKHVALGQSRHLPTRHHRSSQARPLRHPARAARSIPSGLEGER